MPSLRNASPVPSRAVTTDAHGRSTSYAGLSYSGYGRDYYGGHGGYHGHGHHYPHSYFGFHFGYPYYHGSYYWGHYYPHFYVTYPYVGYYYHYPYDYFGHYGYGGCSFYDGFYVRFGYYRSSYFSFCSGFGLHAHGYHHCHAYHCPVHTVHYYHIRDCPLCYPDGGSYVHYHDVEVPETVHEEQIVEAEPQDVVVVGGPEEQQIGEATPQGELRAVDRPEPLEREELFFASLKPAQLSLALGVIQFRNGRYQDATESLYSASLEDPDAPLFKVFLANSLFAIGEYEFASLYLKLALKEWERFPRYRWNFQAQYGNEEDFGKQLELLKDHVQLYPQDMDARLVLAYVLFASGDLGGVAVHLDALQSYSKDPQVVAIARALAREIEHRNGTFPQSEAERVILLEEDANARFLETQSLGEIKNVGSP